MATKSTDKKGGEASEAPQTDSPLLDLSDAAVKRMIKLAKKRGFVTHEELNEVLPSEEVTSDQIEDICAMLNEMGINVVEQEEAEAEAAREIQAGRAAIAAQLKSAETQADTQARDLAAKLATQVDSQLTVH